MRRSWLFFALACAPCACSSSPSGPGVDSGKSVVALSPGEQKSLCDWIAQQYGGYGHALQCSGGGIIPAVRGPSDERSCVNNFENPPASATFCKATVMNVENCVHWKTDSGNLCGGTPPTDCVLLTNNGNCPSLF
jgi:hypothetical protein